MDITGSSNVYYLSPAYLLIIVVLIGFIYHLIRNQEYKNTILSSTIIGIIFSVILVPIDDLMYFLLRMGMFVVLVIFGGFLAVGFKKLRIMNETENFYELENKLEGHRKWWSDQSHKSQTITICITSLLGIVLIISAVCLLTPVENPVQLDLEFTPSNGFINANYTDDGEMIVFIANNTTQCVLTGSSEANATVTITSNDLGMYNQTVPLDPDGNFAYNLDIPQNVSIIKISLEATKPGKDNRSITFFIKKQ
jgi:Ca2+/Na+ antiporter